MESRYSSRIEIPVSPESGLMQWPGDPEFEIEWKLRPEKGDEAEFSALPLGPHAGTHLHTPFHFLPKGKTLDGMPLRLDLVPARNPNPALL